MTAPADTPEVRRRALMEAGERQFLGHGVLSARFQDICDEARVPRASAYRLFPAGIDSILDAFHEVAVAAVLESARDRIADLPRAGITFELAVRAGIEGALSALRETPMTSSVLRRDKALLVAYLLDERPGSFVDVLSAYAARCAANFGSEAPELERVAHDFVWDALQRLLRDVPLDPSSRWPTFDEALDEVIDDFLAKVAGGPLDRERSHLNVPLLEPVSADLVFGRR